MFAKLLNNIKQLSINDVISLIGMVAPPCYVVLYTISLLKNAATDIRNRMEKPYETLHWAHVIYWERVKRFNFWAILPVPCSLYNPLYFFIYVIVTVRRAPIH